MRATIGFNHLFIEAGPLTGPGYYAVQLVEAMLTLAPEQRAGLEFRIFAQRGTSHHYSPEARAVLSEIAPAFGRFGRVLWEQSLLPFYARRNAIDLLFSPAFVSPIWGAKIKVSTIHDMYYRVLPEVVDRNQRYYWQTMMPISTRICDLILTVSENSRRDIERYLPVARGKVVVTPLASRFTSPAAESNRSLLPQSRPFVLIVANLTPNKNVSRLVEAHAMLTRAGRDVDLIHIGSDVLGELASARARFGMEDRVRSLGKVDDATLVAAARASLCMAVPSLYEGFGLPALEAQALGAPLICSDRAALPEVAGDAALLFNPYSAAEIAACIAQLLDHPSLRTELQAKGAANARRFSWQRTAKLTLDAFIAELERS